MILGYSLSKKSMNPSSTTDVLLEAKSVGSVVYLPEGQIWPAKSHPRVSFGFTPPFDSRSAGGGFTQVVLSVQTSVLTSELTESLAMS